MLANAYKHASQWCDYIQHNGAKTTGLNFDLQQNDIMLFYLPLCLVSLKWMSWHPSDVTVIVNAPISSCVLSKNKFFCVQKTSYHSPKLRMVKGHSSYKRPKHDCRYKTIHQFSPNRLSGMRKCIWQDQSEITHIFQVYHFSSLLCSYEVLNYLARQS